MLKNTIAEKAIELIEDGDTIGIDIGTTTLELAKLLKGKRKVTVITNSATSARTQSFFLILPKRSDSISA